MFGFLIYSLAVATGLTALATRKTYQVYSLGAFFQPQAVKQIADSMPHTTEDEFVLSAWQYVGAIPYEAIGSDMEFTNGEVYCEDCYLPNQTLDRKVGNCVAKSALLASILANRIAMNRIQIIVGNYVGADNSGGHAWVELWRGNNWYLLEATKTPSYPVPWIPAESSYNSYKPEIVLENSHLMRVSSEEVQNMVGCACGGNIDKYGRQI
ncbi:MAG: transglutaminase family protein [Dehalococcoidia bacterium]|jgi:transglutaminase-like putative cysteine protease